MTPIHIILPRSRAEAALHRAVAAYLTVALPPDVAWTTFPAGSGGKARGGQLKAAGLRPGWPDLQILWDGKFLGIELKTGKRRLSPAQDACVRLIFRAGGTWTVCRSIDDVERILIAWGMPLRGGIKRR